MTLVAAVRPDGWSIALLVHVLGALILVGGLVAGAAFLGLARGNARFLRYGYWSLLAVCVPGWVLLRVGAEWVSSREGWSDLPSRLQPTWLDIGGIVADAGGLVLLVALAVGGVGIRRLRTGSGSGLLATTLVLSIVLVAANLVAV